MNPTSIEMIEYAVSKLKAAGFHLAFASMISEACYYRFGERRGVLRVAAHKFSRTRDKSVTAPVLACLTFGPDYLPKSADGIDTFIALAVGKYMLADGRGIARWREAAVRRSVCQPDAAGGGDG